MGTIIERIMAMIDDENLPPWLQLSLPFLIGIVCGLFFIWPGLQGVFTQTLPPFSADFGQFMFGNKTLNGWPAIWGGLLMIVTGLCFVFICGSYSRLLRSYSKLIWVFTAVLFLAAQIIFRAAIKFSS